MKRATPPTFVRRSALLASLLAAVLLAACSSFSEPAGERLKLAMGIEVTPVVFGVDDTPEVSYAAEVLLARAEGHYQESEFAEAADEYGRFMSLHATHEWASFALFRQAMSQIHQVKSTDREPSLVRQAAQSFNNLIANYPDSPAVPEARIQLALAREHLASYELGVARFYIRTHRPEASLSRLTALIADYPDTAAAKDAWFPMGQALAASGDTAQAVAAYQHFLDEAPSAQEPGKARDRANKALGKLTQP